MSASGAVQTFREVSDFCAGLCRLAMFFYCIYLWTWSGGAMPSRLIPAALALALMPAFPVRRDELANQKEVAR